MSMNKVILEQRRKLGLTQEQVAAHLGVSTPAVSKWEKGITSPDIALLPSLARLLKIDLNTLFCFSEDLTAKEIGEFCNNLAKQARENILIAFETAEQKLHDYPHNKQLLLNTAIILDSVLLTTPLGITQTDELDAKISDWYFHLSQCEDINIRNSSNYMRANRYIKQNNLEAAQEVLDMIQEKNELSGILPDKLMLQVSIYLQQGKSDLAISELEQALYKESTRIQLLLSKLLDAELTSGNLDYAKSIAEKASAMVDVFDLWEYNKYTPAFQLAEVAKDPDTILPLLEKMLDALKKPWRITDSVLYHKMDLVSKDFQSDELLNMILCSLKSSPDCAYLREHPKFEDIIAIYDTH